MRKMESNMNEQITVNSVKCFHFVAIGGTLVLAILSLIVLIYNAKDDEKNSNAL